MDFPTASATGVFGTYLLEVDDTRPRVLVLASRHRVTQLIATAVQATLDARGLCAELADAASQPPPPADYDAVLIGIPLGWRDRAIESYVADFRDELCDRPSVAFFVGTERQRARALRSHLLARPRSMMVFTTPAWPWQPLVIDHVRIERLVDDVVAALPGGA